jgi:hypothetical protein
MTKLTLIHSMVQEQIQEQQEVRMRTMSDRELYELQFSNLIDELYCLDPHSDDRWSTVKEELSLYKYDALQRLADELRHDLTHAFHSQHRKVA